MSLTQKIEPTLDEWTSTSRVLRWRIEMQHLFDLLDEACERLAQRDEPREATGS